MKSGLLMVACLPSKKVALQPASHAAMSGGGGAVTGRKTRRVVRAGAVYGDYTAARFPPPAIGTGLGLDGPGVADPSKIRSKTATKEGAYQRSKAAPIRRPRRPVKSAAAGASA